MYLTTHERVVQRLQALKGHWPKIAREAGVSYRTLRKIADGTVKNPGTKTLEPIERYLEQHDD
jgi:DNA-binding Xre family transcriptional regulator